MAGGAALISRASMDLYQFFAWLIAMIAIAVGYGALGPLGLILVAAILITAATAAGLAMGGRARRLRSHVEPRFRPTGEVYRDTRTGAVTRVYQDPATGERRYRVDGGDR